MAYLRQHRRLLVPVVSQNWIRHLTELGVEQSLAQLIGSTNLRKSKPEDYKKLRNIITEYGRAKMLGSDIQLTQDELEANKVIMSEKKKEYKKGIMDPTKFAPGYHIFQVLHKIKNSPLFHILTKMPKGGALKTHDTSMCSTDYLIKLTYMKDLWVCTTNKGCRIEEFRFAKEKPNKCKIKGGKWERMEDVRDRRGDDNVRKYLEIRFSMFPLSSFSNNDEAWRHFMGIFDLLDGLIQFAPVWGEYYYNALKEFYADGVQYVETRSTMPRLYCLDGKKLPRRETVQIYYDQMNRFKKEHPEFIGAKLIFAPLRHVTPEVVGKYVKTCSDLNKEFPDFLIGFDLVGQEDVGHPMSMFVEQLIKLPPHINFYFHAGQTNWYGSHTDENVIDAVMLGTRRIGHGFALTKHPIIMELVKKLNIALELCPVSNQVLQLGTDYRNHPAATLIAKNIPLVISSGNPSFWRATPLSHDFYMAFLGIAPMNADLKFLKRISKNSIKYSGVEDEEKAAAMTKWKSKWDKWVKDIVENKDKMIPKETEEKK